MKRNFPGFTLIELLIVIAIIGILSAVVFTQLGSARDKSRVAKLKSEMASLRPQAEVFYNNYNYSYGATGECDPTSGIPMGDLFAFPADQYGMATILDSIRTGVVMDRATLAPRIWCESGGADEWAVIAHISGVNPTPTPIPGRPSAIPEIYWCVDSKGASREITDTNILPTLTTASPVVSGGIPGFITGLTSGVGLGLECPL